MTKNDRGEPVEKRYVKFPGALGHGYYDPSAITPEWSQWLNRVREEPPTEEDILQCAPPHYTMYDALLPCSAAVHVYETGPCI